MLFRQNFLSTLEQCMYRATKSQLVLFFSVFDHFSVLVVAGVNALVNFNTVLISKLMNL